MSDLASLLEKVTVDELAQIIRRVDGNHSLGAGELAEAILASLSHPIKAGEAVPVASEAASRISTLERELEEAREQWGLATLALDSMHQNRDTVQRHFDACTIRATAAEAKAARMGDALKPFADARALVEYSDDNGSAGAWIAASDALHLIPRVKHLRAARSALQSEEDREGEDGR